MDAEDHDDLLPCSSDDDSSTGTGSEFNDERGQPNSIGAAHRTTLRHLLIYRSHSNTQFWCTKLALILSSCALLILLPPYSEVLGQKSDAYGLMVSVLYLSTVLSAMVAVTLRLTTKSWANVRLVQPPLQCCHILLLAVCHVGCAMLVMYALDRKRVPCHVQDPIKGLVLVISLLFYFVFCSKLMGVQRIFAATIAIVGLFVSVDYGLCNEFRCRGWERTSPADDGGGWSWQEHSTWTIVYVIGLCLFVCYFAIVENCLEPKCRTVASNGLLSSLTTIEPLRTISRHVSAMYNGGDYIGNRTQTAAPPLMTSGSDDLLKRSYSSIHLVLWINVISAVITTCLFWTDMLPNVGKWNTTADVLNATASGLFCHFERSWPLLPNNMVNPSNCSYIAQLGWPFVICYLAFMLSSNHFVLLTQSGVYTVTTMSVSLPLVEIWWSLLALPTPFKGQFIWSPAFTGETICALLGLPVILIALLLMYKCHQSDYQWSKQLSPLHQNGVWSDRQRLVANALVAAATSGGGGGSASGGNDGAFAEGQSSVC